MSVAAAYLADRGRRNRAVALVGYALSTVSRLGLILSTGLGLLMAIFSLSIDRLGKGIRTAPRDAIIASHSDATNMAASFGVHRALDAGGAFVGPLLGAGLLWLWPSDFDTLLLCSLVFGLLGLLAFWLKVHEAPSTSQAVHHAGTGATGVATLLTGRAASRLIISCRPFLCAVLLAAVLSVFSISDGLLYLAIQKQSDMGLASVPLMFAATAAVFLVSAVSIGRLADRLGRVKTFMMGHVMLVALYSLIALGLVPSSSALVLTAVVLGLHYAATDGVLVAVAATVLDPRVRTTGLATMATAIGLARIASSALFGACWQLEGQRDAIAIFAVGLGCCLGLAMLIAPRFRSWAQAS